MLLQCFSWSFRRHRQLTGLNPCSNGIWSLTLTWWRLLRTFLVLILVLMEYGLWPDNIRLDSLRDSVLILVLMEYGLWPNLKEVIMAMKFVLILVLMEYGLWPGAQAHAMGAVRCLNPCSNGIWSLTYCLLKNTIIEVSLNPCSNGIWSLTGMLHGMNWNWLS